MLPFDSLLAFGGTCALFLLLVRPIGARPLGTALPFALRVGLGAIVAAWAIVTRPDLLATFRYIAGLYLIAASVIGIRRATVPGQLDSAADAEPSWSDRLALTQVLFGWALFVHVVERAGQAVLTALGGTIAACVAGALVIAAAEATQRRSADEVLVDRRVRQATGLLLLAVAVYLAWP